MAESSPAVRSQDDLLAPFYAACKPRAEWRIGTEAEKCGVHAGGAPVHFAGPNGIQAVLAALATHGWEPHREVEGGEVLSLTRSGASITLEPGGQLELSGAPLRTLHETKAEMDAHLAEIRAIGDTLGISWLGLGFHPFARREDLSWVPKLRYGVMQAYLPTRGSMGLDMMLRTCTVQANLDYASEEDAIRKLRVSLRLSPIVAAMFANSPFVEKRATGERSHRTRVWLNVDPDRSGLLPFAWDEKPMGFARYVDWVLDCPMFMLKRDGKIVRNTGQTFRAFLKDGFEGTHATADDWITHVNSMFPEVRLKRTLEMRSADNQRADLVCALPALWKGLLHDDAALAKAERLVSAMRYEDAERARGDIADHALRAKIGGREVGAWAADVLAIAEEGLARIDDRDERGRDERIHLAALRALVDAGQSPADRLLATIDPKGDLVAQVIALTKL
ncbi:MAG: glutamate-cysteine ligase family protein [Sandaracinus sp.]